MNNITKGRNHVPHNFSFGLPRNKNFLPAFTGTNTNLKIIITQDVVCVNSPFSLFCVTN